MTATAATEHWATLAGQATWRCSPSGFAHASVLSGTQALVAVGRMAPSHSPNTRAAIDAVLRDVGLTEGYDATAVFGLANAALGVEELGIVDAIALFSGDDTLAGGVDDTWPYVTGHGSPAPMVVTTDGTTEPAEGGRALGPGWAVVLADAGPPLAPQTAFAALTAGSAAPAGGAAGAPPRTVLAVFIG